MKTFDVVALGELLVDFTENGISVRGNPVTTLQHFLPESFRGESQQRCFFAFKLGKTVL